MLLRGYMPQGGFPLDYRQFRHPMGARMKKIVAAAAAVAAFGFVGAASAADMAVKAPIYRAPPFSWTGCYVGLDVGYAWERDRLTETAPNCIVDSAATRRRYLHHGRAFRSSAPIAARPR